MYARLHTHSCRRMRCFSQPHPRSFNRFASKPSASMQPISTATITDTSVIGML